MIEFAYVLDCNGNPLIPSKNLKKIFQMIDNGLCTIVSHKPFTVKLTYKSNHYKQNLTLGVDSGTKYVGLSVIQDNKTEVFKATVELLKDMTDRLTKRKNNRISRRKRLRYRKPRFNNRKKKILMPSVEHLLNEHLRVIKKVYSILPITFLNIELGKFDTQKILNPDIQGVEYQQGKRSLNELELKAFVKDRDGYKCQNPKCLNKDKDQVLQVHHIINRSKGGSNSINNLITLCNKCHSPENHHNGVLDNLKPKSIKLDNATKMSIIASFLLKELKLLYKNVNKTNGFNTSYRRKQEGLEKSHSNDAFIIADGKQFIERCLTEFNIEMVRRNNRRLSYFYDKKMIDKRDGSIKSGSELNCGRTCRNINKNSENLRVYRGEIVRKGRFSIRKSRPKFQPNDLIKFEGKLYNVISSINKGKSIMLKDCKKYPSTKKIKLIKYGKGIYFL